jgi:predicted hotdog family 3-hydroxylacyl-ACP dehydratase
MGWNVGLWVQIKKMAQVILIWNASQRQANQAGVLTNFCFQVKKVEVENSQEKLHFIQKILVT